MKSINWWPILAVAVIVAACGTPANNCDHPPPGIGGIVKGAEAAASPCQGRDVTFVLKSYTQAGHPYPLRCGRAGARGYGYLHIFDEPLHGDPLSDPTFNGEIAYTLEHGIEGQVGGGNYRYTVRYDDVKAVCFNLWGFRVVLAKAPAFPDGRPAGIITAAYYRAQPTVYP
jgi:hypothetical protein